jgi:hypothetical protein
VAQLLSLLCRPGAARSTRADLLRKAASLLPVDPVPLLAETQGSLRLASPRAVFIDACVLSGGESGFRWLGAMPDGRLSHVLFWEQTRLGRLVTRVRESPRLQQLMSAADVPLQFGASGYGRWVFDPSWGDLSGGRSTRLLSHSGQASFVAACQACSIGPCCLSLLYAPPGPRRSHARSWLGLGAWHRLINVQPNDAVHVVLSSVAHLNFAQREPLSRTESGLRQLIAAQVGGGAKAVSDYLTRDYDLRGYATYFNRL